MADPVVAELAIGRLQRAYADAGTRRAWDELAALATPGCPFQLDTGAGGVVELIGGEAFAAFGASTTGRFGFYEYLLLNHVVEFESSRAERCSASSASTTTTTRWSMVPGSSLGASTRPSPDGWAMVHCRPSRTKIDGNSRSARRQQPTSGGLGAAVRFRWRSADPPWSAAASHLLVDVGDGLGGADRAGVILPR